MNFHVRSQVSKRRLTPEAAAPVDTGQKHPALQLIVSSAEK